MAILNRCSKANVSTVELPPPAIDSNCGNVSKNTTTKSYGSVHGRMPKTSDDQNCTKPCEVSGKKTLVEKIHEYGIVDWPEVKASLEETASDGDDGPKLPENDLIRPGDDKVKDTAPGRLEDTRERIRERYRKIYKGYRDIFEEICEEKLQIPTRSFIRLHDLDTGMLEDAVALPKCDFLQQVDLKSRIHSPTIRIYCGSIGAGKSSLINPLIGLNECRRTHDSWMNPYCTSTLRGGLEHEYLEDSVGSRICDFIRMGEKYDAVQKLVFGVLCSNSRYSPTVRLLEGMRTERLKTTECKNMLLFVTCRKGDIGNVNLPPMKTVLISGQSMTLEEKSWEHFLRYINKHCSSDQSTCFFLTLNNIFICDMSCKLHVITSIDAEEYVAAEIGASKNMEDSGNALPNFTVKVMKEISPLELKENNLQKNIEETGNVSPNLAVNSNEEISCAAFNGLSLSKILEELGKVHLSIAESLKNILCEEGILMEYTNVAVIDCNCFLSFFSPVEECNFVQAENVCILESIGSLQLGITERLSATPEYMAPEMCQWYLKGPLHLMIKTTKDTNNNLFDPYMIPSKYSLGTHDLLMEMTQHNNANIVCVSVALKLIKDFDIIKIRRTDTRQTSYSPEKVESRQYGEKADIWAVGNKLYHILDTPGIYDDFSTGQEFGRKSKQSLSHFLKTIQTEFILEMFVMKNEEFIKKQNAETERKENASAKHLAQTNNLNAKTVDILNVGTKPEDGESYSPGRRPLQPGTSSYHKTDADVDRNIPAVKKHRQSNTCFISDFIGLICKTRSSSLLFMIGMLLMCSTTSASSLSTDNTTDCSVMTFVPPSRCVACMRPTILTIQRSQWKHFEIDNILEDNIHVIAYVYGLGDELVWKTESYSSKADKVMEDIPFGAARMRHRIHYIFLSKWTHFEIDNILEDYISELVDVHVWKTESYSSKADKVMEDIPFGASLISGLETKLRKLTRYLELPQDYGKVTKNGSFVFFGEFSQMVFLVLVIIFVVRMLPFEYHGEKMSKMKNISTSKTKTIVVALSTSTLILAFVRIYLGSEEKKSFEVSGSVFLQMGFCPAMLCALLNCLKMRVNQCNDVNPSVEETSISTGQMCIDFKLACEINESQVMTVLISVAWNDTLPGDQVFENAFEKCKAETGFADPYKTCPATDDWYGNVDPGLSGYTTSTGSTRHAIRSGVGIVGTQISACSVFIIVVGFLYIHAHCNLSIDSLKYAQKHSCGVINKVDTLCRLIVSKDDENSADNEVDDESCAEDEVDDESSANVEVDRHTDVIDPNTEEFNEYNLHVVDNKFEENNDDYEINTEGNIEDQIVDNEANSEDDKDNVGENDTKTDEKNENSIGDEGTNFEENDEDNNDDYDINTEGNIEDQIIDNDEDIVDENDINIEETIEDQIVDDEANSEDDRDNVGENDTKTDENDEDDISGEDANFEENDEDEVGENDTRSAGNGRNPSGVITSTDPYVADYSESTDSLSLAGTFRINYTFFRFVYQVESGLRTHQFKKRSEQLNAQARIPEPVDIDIIDYDEEAFDAVGISLKCNNSAELYPNRDTFCDETPETMKDLFKDDNEDFEGIVIKHQVGIVHMREMSHVICPIIHHVGVIVPVSEPSFKNTKLELEDLEPSFNDAYEIDKHSKYKLVIEEEDQPMKVKGKVLECSTELATSVTAFFNENRLQQSNASIVAEDQGSFIETNLKEVESHKELMNSKSNANLPGKPNDFRDLSDERGNMAEIRTMSLLSEFIDLPVPHIDMSYLRTLVYRIEEPLMSVIDRLASPEPPTPHVSMRYELLRFCTLRTYPRGDKPYLLKLAAAGFYYASDGDGVVCYCCGSRRYNWTGSEDPMKVHQGIKPNCRFLKKNEDVNVPVVSNGPWSAALCAIEDIPAPTLIREELEVVNREYAPERQGNEQESTQEQQTLGINNARPKHQDYSVKTKRLQSYKDWPTSAKLKPEELSDSGFFYAGFGDCVRCFFCGIGLRHWSNDDDPWIEHARWARTCVFVRQKKGEEFVNLVQLAVQLTQDNGPTGATVGSSMPASTLEKMLLSKGALNAAEMGFNTGIIKRAVEEMISNGVTGNVSPDDLLCKVLEIEGRDERAAAAASNSTPTTSSSTPTTTTQVAKKVSEETPTTAVAAPAKPAMNATVAVANDATKKTKTPENTKKSDKNSDPDSLQDPVAIKHENEVLKEQTLCKVCLDNTVCIVFLPCGHLVTCADCAPAMRKCPICRALVRGTVRTYMS